MYKYYNILVTVRKTVLKVAEKKDLQGVKLSQFPDNCAHFVCIRLYS